MLIERSCLLALIVLLPQALLPQALVARAQPQTPETESLEAQSPTATATNGAGEPSDLPAANEKVAEIMRSFQGRGVMADASKPTPPAEAQKQFKIAPGTEIELVAAEPVVSQPLFLSWDSRGRMWVVHYRQYQFPAGLKVVRYDQHLRAIFDKVPDPPPHGTPGADKITVHEDTDGDGRYDSQKDVITGLNIATSVQVGCGGIWVLNPPYLLFYPDADCDDVPDAQPEVCLSGFGMQDTHAVANSLLWGPDGWLYGSNGSTTTCDISSKVTKGVRFEGQCIWRYHPTSKVFEIYAEGGGNTFSLEIDSAGRVFSGTNGGNTRGFYFPQGSYNIKNWGKHGPLTNPYAFGFFGPMKFLGDGRRFPQAFCIYEGGLFPQEFNGTIIAPNSLHNVVWHSDRKVEGSTYRTVDLENLVETPDRWFRPVYSGVGPDGAVYMADWYDTRLSHVSPVDDWHKESGRIYRLKPAGSVPRLDSEDLHTMSSDSLVARLDHDNKWVRKRAVLELGWRGDNSIVPKLLKMSTLESLWTLFIMNEFTNERAGDFLSHSSPDIRRWAVRLLGDRHESHPHLTILAESELDLQVLSQLASTAKRLPTADGLAIANALVRRGNLVDDEHLPLLIWWAIEAHATDREAILAMVRGESVWSLPLFDRHIASRLMQRYAATATQQDLETCAQLWALAPSEGAKARLMTGLNLAFQGRSLPPLPDSLAAALAAYQASLGDSGLVLALRGGNSDATEGAISALVDPTTELDIRLELAKTLGEIKTPASVDALLRLATGQSTSEPALQRVAIASLATYEDPQIAKKLIDGFGSKISVEHGLRAAAYRTLASRSGWAKLLLEELTQWRLRPQQIPAEVIQQLRTHDDPKLIEVVESVFGKNSLANSPEQLAEIKRVRDLLALRQGDPQAGKAHFVKKCGNCHQLFGEGNKVGPPLDGYERGNVNFWLMSIVQPSLEIREGFQSYMALSVDGRAINGMIAASDPKTVTLRNAENQMTVIARDEIELLKALPTSLMPTGLLDQMKDEEIQDLFAYLMR